MIRYLPGVLCVVLILLGGLLGAYSVMVQQQSRSSENQKIRVAMVGTAEDTFVQMGLAALKSFDSTQFAMELLEMEEDAAHRALQQGKIGAYIVIPENFVDEAMEGRILPLKFVSTTGAAGVVSVLKEEVTDVISVLLLESQRGVYGMQGAMKDNDLGGRGKKMDALSLNYVEYVLARDKAYSLRELGIADELGLEGYLLCGVAVLFLMLACLPFAPLMIRRDLSLSRMLAARGRGMCRQTLCDLGVYALGLMAVVFLLLGAAGGLLGDRMEQLDMTQLLIRMVPVLVMVVSYSFMLYALSSDLIGGVLLQFFATLAMCFVSGCMYPVYFFPVGVQKLAAWLPAGIARSHLAGSITGASDPQALLMLLGYSGVFCLVGVLARLRCAKEASL